MADLLLTQTFPPIHLSAARRLLESITVDLDLPAYQASGLLEAKIRLSPEGESASLALRSDPSGILASCALCRTEQDLPCTHAIAVLLIFRERTASRYPLPPALGKSLPSIPDFPGGYGGTPGAPMSDTPSGRDPPGPLFRGLDPQDDTHGPPPVPPS